MPYVLDTNYATVGNLEGLPPTSISKLQEALRIKGSGKWDEASNTALARMVAKFGPAVNAQKSLERLGLSTAEARDAMKTITAWLATPPEAEAQITASPSEPASGTPIVESWFSQYKWWLVGGSAALAILVTTAFVLRSRKSATAMPSSTAGWSH